MREGAEGLHKLLGHVAAQLVGRCNWSELGISPTCPLTSWWWTWIASWLPTLMWLYAWVNLLPPPPHLTMTPSKEILLFLGVYFWGTNMWHCNVHIRDTVWVPCMYGGEGGHVSIELGWGTMHMQSSFVSQRWCTQSNMNDFSHSTLISEGLVGLHRWGRGHAESENEEGISRE